MRVLATIICLFIIDCLLAQDFQGIATYRSSQRVFIEPDSTRFNDAEIKEFQEQLRKQFENEYSLKFNSKESLYSKVEQLKLDDPKISSARIVVVGDGGNRPLYRNISEKKYVKEEDLIGKAFLVKDSLTLPDWKLEDEQKTIGQYTCYKATWTREEEVSKYNSETGATKEKVQRSTTAWYTPEIPVSHGPQQFWGLPGLILEIQEEKFSLLCTAITLNPTERFEIEAPKKGKEIDQESYNKIREEKTKEMMEQFSKGREKGTIRIRG